MNKMVVLVLSLISFQYGKAQNNSFPTTGSVGIGTTTPLSKLEVRGGNFLIKNLSNTAGESVPMISQSLSFGDYTTYGTSINTFTESADYNAYGLQILTQETYATGLTEKLRVMPNGNVGIGSKNPLAKLSVDGNILAKEIKVKTDIAVPDYVFEAEYKLPGLPDLEQYVKLNKHLPEVPSAKEIEKNGLDLAEMNLILLKKVEELTLHLIEKDKEISGIKEGYKSLVKRLEKIENVKK